MDGLDVVVIGAGIGGLTTAIALQRLGHRVQVFDQVRALRPIGAGLSLWPNGVKVLNLLGLGDTIDRLTGHMARMAYRDQLGETLCDFELAPLVERAGQRPGPIARAALQQLLMDEAGPQHVQLGRRCTGVREHDDGITATFDDGTEVVADLVVAADGTHSKLRAHVLGRTVGRDYVGYVNLNGTVSAEPPIVPLGTWTIFVGEGKRASLMPIGPDRQYFFFDIPLPADQLDDDRDVRTQLRSHFGAWAPEVHELIDRLDPADVARIPIHDHEPLDRMARGRVALLGDAAHATAPDLGQGACQAMEDAMVLARYLTTTRLGVVDALARYSAERTPHTADIMRRARQRARLTHNADPVATAAWYDELKAETGEHILEGLAKSVVGGPWR